MDDLTVASCFRNKVRSLSLSLYPRGNFSNELYRGKEQLKTIFPAYRE